MDITSTHDEIESTIIYELQEFKYVSNNNVDPF